MRKNRKMTQSTKNKISQKMKGNKNPMFGKKQSDETKKKISDAMKKYWENVPE